jgi:hypothetical protein
MALVTEKVKGSFITDTLHSLMEVLAVTLTISICLTLVFVASFAAHLRCQKGNSIEHDSLLPLDEDSGATPQLTNDE